MRIQKSNLKEAIEVYTDLVQQLYGKTVDSCSVVTAKCSTELSLYL